MPSEDLLEKWIAVDSPKGLQSNERYITVTGPVPVASGQTATLEERIPLGINPTILELEAMIEGQPDGKLMLILQHVYFQKLLKQRGEYKNVEVYNKTEKTSINVTVGETLT